MAIIKGGERTDRIAKEAELVWKWLKKLPEYIADYQLQSKLGPEIDTATKEYLKNKYGFSPLINPKRENDYILFKVPGEFVVRFSQCVGHPFNDNGVKFKNITSFNLWAKESPEKYRNNDYNGLYKVIDLPQKLVVEIDPHKPTALLLDEIRYFLNRLKKVYGVKDERSRSVGMSKVYMVYVMENLGKEKAKIKQKIEPLIRDAGLKESRTKKAGRILKKAKKLRTDK